MLWPFNQEPKTNHSASDEIILSGQTWQIVWTKHALNRTYDRRSNPTIAAQLLRQALEYLNRAVPDLSNKLGSRATIRSYATYGCYVLQPVREADGNKLRVITYGTASDFFPKTGDKVFTISADLNVFSTEWQDVTRKNEQHEKTNWGRALSRSITSEVLASASI